MAKMEWPLLLVKVTVRIEQICMMKTERRRKVEKNIDVCSMNLAMYVAAHVMISITYLTMHA